MSDRQCSDCGTAINRRSKSGMCRKCIWARQVADPEFQRRRVAGLVRNAAYNPGRTCKGCAKPIGPYNRTGFCLPCFNRDPECAARRGAGVSAHVRQMLDSDPEFARKLREKGRGLGKSGLGNAAAPAGSEARRRAAQTSSDNYLSWCPREYREFYRKTLRRLRYAFPARKATLKKIEADRLTALTTFDNLNSACDHLRRYTAVIKRDDGYLYGTVKLTPEQLIKRALDKGWQPPFARAA